MMTLSRQKLLAKMQQAQIPSLLQLAKQAGLNRNTINYYLSGASLLPKGFLKICQILGTSPNNLINSDTPPSLYLTRGIASAIDRLAKRFPELTFTLFGSRARGTAKTFSDWDIGFFSSNQVNHETHLELLDFVDDLNNELDIEIDAINLNEAKAHFLIENKDDFLFLKGSLSDWLQFKTTLNK